jgi:hypothetical protein
MKANGGMKSQCTFALWQPVYAEHRIATFPVEMLGDRKKPMISHYGNVGLRGSEQLAFKFADAELFGFMCGPRSKVTVLDIDSTSDVVLGNAIARHGRTPILVRTASGKWQAYYRHNGERRRIRPFRGLPIDILGGGVAVAPPSKTAHGHYEFIGGSLDELGHLPVMRNVPHSKPQSNGVRGNGAVRQGERNERLFTIALQAARYCDDFDVLCDVAMTRNAEFSPPLEDDEVIKVARSAWRYETEGRNYSGGQVAVFRHADVIPLMPDPYVGMLIVWAKANFKPDAEFWIADGLAAEFGWTVYELRQARRRAIAMGVFKLIRPNGYRRPAAYGFGTGL